VQSVKALADQYSQYGFQRMVQSYSDTFYSTVQQGLVQEFSAFLGRFQQAIDQLVLVRFDAAMANVSVTRKG